MNRQWYVNIDGRTRDIPLDSVIKRRIKATLKQYNQIKNWSLDAFILNQYAGFMDTLQWYLDTPKWTSIPNLANAYALDELATIVPPGSTTGYRSGARQAIAWLIGEAETDS